MNGVDFLTDTNFIIHLNQGNVIVEPFLEYNYAISFNTEIELLGAFSISRAQKQQFQDFIDDCNIIEMDYRLKMKCIDFRNQYKLKIPNAIIAATSILYNIPLITSDKEFQKIKETTTCIS